MVASMRQQYGLRIRGEEFASMSWDEFADLLSGLGEDTPLVRVAQIRTESDPERIRAMSPAQRAMRSAWQRRSAMRKSSEDVEAFLGTVQTALSGLFGKEG